MRPGCLKVLLKRRYELLSRSKSCTMMVQDGMFLGFSNQYVFRCEYGEMYGEVEKENMRRKMEKLLGEHVKGRVTVV